MLSSVPLTFLYELGAGLDNYRSYIFHSFAECGAKHLVLSHNLMPEILKTLAELASSNASAAEIMAALPDLNDGQLNRVTGYIQALRSLSGVGGASIMEEKNA